MPYRACSVCAKTKAAARIIVAYLYALDMDYGRDHSWVWPSAVVGYPKTILYLKYDALLKSGK